MHGEEFDLLHEAGFFFQLTGDEHYLVFSQGKEL